MKKHGRIITAGLTLHPEDPRVVETVNIKQFQNVRLQGKFQAAVLHRHARPAATQLHHQFAEILKEYDALGANHIIHGKLVGPNHVALKDFPAAYQPVRAELQAMANTYQQLTGLEKIRILILANLSTPADHTHNYPVLASSWLKSGAVWKNEQEKSIGIDEGDWLYISEGFKHGSPTNNLHRISIAVQPDLT